MMPLQIWAFVSSPFVNCVLEPSYAPTMLVDIYPSVLLSIAEAPF